MKSNVPLKVGIHIEGKVATIPCTQKQVALMGERVTIKMVLAFVLSAAILNRANK
jgi:hypothetical protein